MSNSILLYKNHVNINFKERGDSFSLSVPHYSKWRSIISFLRRRGFIVSENESVKINYPCLSKYRKIAIKGDVIILMEIGCSFIKMQYGNSKNRWKGLAQGFWSDWHEDYIKLTYLESLAIRMEIQKLLSFFSKHNHEINDKNKKLSPEEFIIKKLKTNNHIHGVVNSLEYIKRSITKDSYNYKRNSNDKNGKKIICGDTKYFYDYKGNIARGIAWHNINNMWWMISNKKLYNIASFDLFDYDSNLPRRKQYPERSKSINSNK